MDAETEIRRVAVVGTGLIGSSWAACFLAHGLDVTATDPAPGAEDALRRRVEPDHQILLEQLKLRLPPPVEKVGSTAAGEPSAGVCRHAPPNPGNILTTSAPKL
jgi:3-hydroxyacyl-CoA dehydrogenase